MLDVDWRIYTVGITHQSFSTALVRGYIGTFELFGVVSFDVSVCYML